MSLTLEEKVYRACLDSQYDDSKYVEAKKILLEPSNIDVNYTRADGRTFLYVLCSKANISKSDMELIELLLQKGADPNKADPLTNNTPLYIICIQKVQRVPLVQKLLDYGADPTRENFNGDTPLYSSILRSKDVWNLMLSRGANVNYLNKYNDHILHKIFDLKNNHLLTYYVPDLLKYGADVFAENASGKIPLLLALDMENLLVTQWLTVYMIALAEEREEAKKFLNLCKVILAILDPETCQNNNSIELLQNINDYRGANLNQLLFLATSTYVQNPKLVEELLRRGANVDSKDSRDLTPLFRALIRDNVKSAEAIMRYKPDLRVVHQDAGNVLHFVAKFCTTTDADCFNLIYDLVVNHEAMKLIDSQNEISETPLMTAHRARNFENCLTLLELGAILKLLDSRLCDMMGFCPIATHLRKLCMIGYVPVRGSAEELQIQQHSRNCCYVLDLENTNHPEYKSLENEISILKNEFVNELPKTSLFDVLLMNRRHMATYSANERLATILEDVEFFRKYKFYGKMLKYRFFRGLKRKNCLSPAEKTLDLLLGKSYFNNECSEMILQYLGEKQLRELASEDNFLRYIKQKV